MPLSMEQIERIDRLNLTPDESEKFTTDSDGEHSLVPGVIR